LSTGHEKFGVAGDFLPCPDLAQTAQERIADETESSQAVSHSKQNYTPEAVRRGRAIPRSPAHRHSARSARRLPRWY